MAYGTGQRIAAQDLRDFSGSPTSGNNALTAHPNVASAQDKAGALWGVGYAQRGYGQTSPSLTLPDSGDRVTAADWNSLFTIMDNLAAHQGSSITSRSVSPGDRIAEFANLGTDLQTLDANRFDAAGGWSWTLLATDTRSSTWSSTIGSEAAIAWASGDEARYFFNAGGRILLRPRHPVTSTPQDSNWNSILANRVGDINIYAIMADQTSASNPFGTITSIGYYGSAGFFQNVYDGTNIGTGAYSSNDVLIQIRRSSAADVSGNGDNGDVINIRIFLSDEHTNTFYDQVAAGTYWEIWAGRKLGNGVTTANPASVTFPNSF